MGGAAQTGRTRPPCKYSKTRGKEERREASSPARATAQPAVLVEEEIGGRVNKDGRSGPEFIRSDSSETRKVKVEFRQKIN